MPKLGAHVSAQGGAFQIFARGQALGAECLQLFTRAPSQWKAVPLTEEAVARFKTERKAHGNPSVIAHDIYLNNLAAADETIRRRSIETMVEEVGRCYSLGVDGLVCHLGAHADGPLGLRRYSEAMAEIFDRTGDRPLPILLETCAGQGTTLGHQLEHLAQIIALNGGSPRLGVCVDTCHLFAAGYDLRSRRLYDAFWRAFDDILGLDRLKALHLNDSKKALGSRVDRHDHIGLGEIGPSTFRWLVRDGRFRKIPAVIETPELETMGKTNLDALKALRRPSRSRTAAASLQVQDEPSHAFADGR